MLRRLLRDAPRAHAGFLRGIDVALRRLADPAARASRDPEISGWSVAEHLEHLLRYDRQTVDWLEGVRDGVVSDRDGEGWTWAGYLVMALRFIPRGGGTARDPTRPVGLDLTEVEAGFRSLRNRVAGLEPALARLERAGATRRHPHLGDFTAADWMRFARIHHEHHDRIIRQILASRSAEGQGSGPPEDGG